VEVLEIHSLVSISHVLAFVSVGTTKEHGKEVILLADLMFHVGVLEEILDSGISKDLFVEEGNSSIHGGLASDSLVD